MQRTVLKWFHRSLHICMGQPFIGHNMPHTSTYPIFLFQMLVILRFVVSVLRRSQISSHLLGEAKLDRYLQCEITSY